MSLEIKLPKLWQLPGVLRFNLYEHRSLAELAEEEGLAKDKKWHKRSAAYIAAQLWMLLILQFNAVLWVIMSTNTIPWIIEVFTFNKQ